MSRFDAFLHRTGERLALPGVTRSLILVEIAADLEDLFQHYLEHGMSEDEAASRAEEKVDMSDQALVELVRIHSDARGWTERMIRRAQPFWERMAMSLIVLFFVTFAAVETNLNPFAHTTGFIWPVAVIALLLALDFVVQLARSTDESSPGPLRDGLVTPLFLGAASALTGFLGAGITLFVTFRAMAADPQRAGATFSAAFLDVTSTLALALLVTLLAGLCWFVLAGRVTRVEDRAVRSFREVS